MDIYDIIDIYNKYVSQEDFVMDDQRYWGEISNIADDIKRELYETR